MSRFLKRLLIGALLAWSMVPFEAKAAAVSLLTGRPSSEAAVASDDDGTIGRPAVARHHRPARLARVAPAAPSVAAFRRDRGVPLPAFRASYARLAVFCARTIEGHALDLGRERAPPA